MKKSRLKLPVLFSVVFCVFSVIALVLTAEKTSETLWDGYRILCVSPPDREEDLLSVLHSAGIENYVTQSNSAFVPCQNLTPVISFLPEAERQRSRWFFNPEYSHRIIYIEESGLRSNYGKILGKFLDTSGFSWILEENNVFLWTPVVLLLLVVASAVCFFPAFPAVLAASVFPLLFALTRNSFSGWLSAFFCLCGITSFFASVFPRRVVTTFSQRMDLCRKNSVYFLPWFAAAFFPLFNHGAGLFFVLLVPAGSAALLYLLNIFFPSVFSADSPLFMLRNRKRLHPVFKAEVMKSPVTGLVFSGKKLPDAGVFLFQLAWAVVLIPAAVFLFSVDGKTEHSGVQNEKKTEYFNEKNEKNAVYALCIPAPERYTAGTGFSSDTFKETVLSGFFSGFEDSGGNRGSAVFSLSDFVALQWNISAYPWRKLNSPFEIPEPGDTVTVPRVIKNGEGEFLFENEIKAEFNSDFIMNIFEHNASPLEKMLIRQKRFIKAGWTEMPR